MWFNRWRDPRVRDEITNNWLSVLGRLKPGATVEQANAAYGSECGRTSKPPGLRRR